MVNQKSRGAFEPTLPPGLENLLEDYRQHCRKNGLRNGSIALYPKEDRWFLYNLAKCGCGDASQINPSRIITACLALESNSYLATVRTFLRYLSEYGYTDRDYSYVVPPYKRPQPMPSVYSEDEIRLMESAIDRSSPPGKRDYAVLLLASRIGIRTGDIATLTFDELDFKADVIRMVQQKTTVPLELPMLPELKAALLDYIQNERPRIDSPFVFLTIDTPDRHISVQSAWKRVATAMCKAGIVHGTRRRGPRSLRSSLASSMVNDGVPYEAVRRTLGHNDLNAIKNYARLDAGQLRFYALPVPEASGAFADFLAGRRCL